MLKEILVVDDSELNRKLLVSTLQNAGVENEIHEAQDGENALKILRKKHKKLCLVFLDWQLPGIDGLEVLKQMAQENKTKELPVIMLTSATSPESEEIALMLNPKLKAFIMKPLNPEKIIEISKPLINQEQS